VEPTPSIAPVAPARPSETVAPPPAPVDSVSISSEARALAANRQAVDAAPDVRADRVAELKQRIASGEYSVPASVLARKLIEHDAI
jgi:flagellar biosynthesis anti-sigma factor FlgM